MKTSCIVLVMIGLVGFVSASIFSPSAHRLQLEQRAFSQGLQCGRRDHLVSYSTQKFASSELFCTQFNAQCTKYAEANDYHPQLDCAFSHQKGPRLLAWCGGINKDGHGNWDPRVGMVDLTRRVVPLVDSAKVVAKPMSLKACKKAARRNKNLECSC